MLAVHGLWDHRREGSLVLWAEDGDLPDRGPARRGPPPALPRPRRHPFAVPPDRLADALAAAGCRPGGRAVGEATTAEAVLWLPGAADRPEPSPELVRAATGDDGPGDGRRARPSGLHPFAVPAWRVGPGPAVDLLLALAGCREPDLRPGGSVAALAAVAELALEVVAAGRVLPDLVAGGSAGHLARWAAVGGGSHEERLRRLAAALPPVCRSLGTAPPPAAPGRGGRRAGAGGPDPGTDGGAGGAGRRSAAAGGRAARPDPRAGAEPAAIVGHAFSAMVDAACRQALRRGGCSLAPGGRRGAGTAPAVVGAWLAALTAPTPAVVADPASLAALGRQVTEWRAGAAGGGGDWRLCFRLREPAGRAATDGVGQGPHASEKPGLGSPGGHESTAWEVELLLQATDDLSLVVAAGEVWRSGASLGRAARVLRSPQETLLAELGRAVRAYPELSAALRQPTPTGVVTDLEGAHRFLAEVAPALEVAGFGVLLPAWWRRPSSRLGVRLRAAPGTGRGRGGAGAGLLTQDGLVAFDWEAALGDRRIGLAELQRLAALKAPLVQVRGEWMELRADEVARLVEFLGSGRPAARREMTVADVLRVAAGLEAPAAGVPLVGFEADGLLGALLQGEVEGSIEVRGTPEGFAGELRPYQQRGVAWMELLGRAGLGACLADDMGLGKTAMVLALLQAERAAPRRRAGAGRRPAAAAGKGTVEGAGAVPGPTLVVCPTSVVGNWQREAERFTPGLRVLVHHGTGRVRSDGLADAAALADLVVTSYQLVVRDRTALATVPWSRVVLDEAQNVKNPDAKQTRAVRSLPAARRVALTGTPVENHLGELWSIMEILNPGLLGTAAAFQHHFAVPIERYREEDAAARLRTLTRPFVLRRLKTDRAVISDLPDKLEIKVACTLTREQATLYQAVVDDMLRRIDEAEGIERKGLVLATMLRLKQVCNHPAQYLGDGSALAGRSGKLDRTAEILGEVLEAGEKALVFTQFAEMGTMLQDHLQRQLGCRVAFLHGGVPRRRRDEMVQALQEEGPGTPVMVLSLKAGGTGLNLTGANHVVHYDRWWNPAVEDQATDRAFRIGQRRDVQVRKLVCAGTLEDRIDEMIESKRDLAERTVGTGEGWLTELSTEELAEAFRLSAATVGAG